MNPRPFINFLNSRSGKLVVFVCLFVATLLLYQRNREKAGDQEDPNTVVPPGPEISTNRPQLVETVLRSMEAFRPPPPKADPKPQPVLTNRPAQLPAKEAPEIPLPISLYADTVSQQPKPRQLGPDYAPYGRLISCETIITVDSASIRTPIIGLVTEDVYHAGRRIIPAGTEVHGTAASDRIRERLASGSAWTLVWQSGEELRLSAIALDREFESTTNLVGWGITDGSAGLRGRVLKSDNLAEIKLFAATFLSGAAKSLTEKQATIFGPVDSPSLNNAPFEGAEKVLSVYAERIYESIQRDGFYVRIPSGKQFYLYVLQTIDRADAQIGGTGSGPGETNDWSHDNSSSLRLPIPTSESFPQQPFNPVHP